MLEEVLLLHYQWNDYVSWHAPSSLRCTLSRILWIGLSAILKSLSLLQGHVLIQLLPFAKRMCLMDILSSFSTVTVFAPGLNSWTQINHASKKGLQRYLCDIEETRRKNKVLAKYMVPAQSSNKTKPTHWFSTYQKSSVAFGVIGCTHIGPSRKKATTAIVTINPR